MKSVPRLSPVHTGQMNRTISFARAIQVHPRAYGVDMLLNLLVNVATGSSPCIRGGFIGSSVPNLEHRFIPVHTGRIPSRHFFAIFCQAHPRAYGADTKFLEKSLRLRNYQFQLKF